MTGWEWLLLVSVSSMWPVMMLGFWLHDRRLRKRLHREAWERRRRKGKLP